MNDLLDSLHGRRIFQRKGQKPQYQTPLRQDDPTPVGQNECEGKHPWRGEGALTPDGGTKLTIPSFLAKLDWRVKEGKRWPSHRYAKPYGNQERI